MSYRHGAYGDYVPSQESITTSQGIIPVYIGTAPVHRLISSANSINKPIIIKGSDDAREKLGYSANDNVDDFTLSGAVFAHFSNRIKPIGPIVVINILDPSKHKKASQSASVTLVNGKGYIDDYVILDSISIATKVKGTDYEAEYTEDGRVLITSIEDKLTSPVTVSYTKVDISAIVESDVIGTYDIGTDKRTGIACIQTIFEELNVIPSIITAPGWNHKPNVEKALVAASHKIGDHWEAIPVTDIDPTASKTIEEAKQWKITNSYNNIREKLCWPKAKVGDKILWLSIITIVRMMQTDYDNGNIPYESPSNKQIDIVTLVLGDGKEVKFNSQQGNMLNEKGITTAIYFGGKYVLWGPHMSNYEYNVTEKADEIFDSCIRMNLYLLNDFQQRNAAFIDTPISRNDVDSILNTEQLRLNSLVSDGKLLYGQIEFKPTSNPTSDLVQGDFTFDSKVTNTPTGKSLTNRVQYTTKGLNSFGGENNG